MVASITRWQVLMEWYAVCSDENKPSILAHGGAATKALTDCFQCLFEAEKLSPVESGKRAMMPHPYLV